MQALEVNILKKELGNLPGLYDAILFGSAVNSELTDQSDLDVVLIFDTSQNLKNSREIYYQSKILGKLPRDIIWLDKKSYDQYKDLGGIAFIAKQSGLSIFKVSECEGNQV
ncbi:MAG: nucleotidyltransferase domain-containing protein [Bdellovibrionales bacterium]